MYNYLWLVYYINIKPKQPTSNIMKNLKALALSAALAATTLFGGAAEAAPKECVFIYGNDVVNTTCDHSVRVNSNGHNVDDMVLFGRNGSKMEFSVIWWQTNGQHDYVEVFYEGKREAHSSYTAKNGMWCFAARNWRFCTR